MTEKFLKSITLCLLNCILRQRFSILVNPNVLYNRLWNGDSKQNKINEVVVNVTLILKSTT